MNSVGKRYQCGGCDTILIVTRGGEGDVACCGGPFGRTDQPGSVVKRPAILGADGANKLGQRLGCATCGTEAIVVTAGGGTATCHGRLLLPVTTAQIASAD